MRRFLRRHPGWVGMVALLVVGSIVRLALSTRDGHISDIRIFHAWLGSLVEVGLTGFYSKHPSCNYPPLYLLILQGLGEALAALGIDLSRADLVRACLRVPACLADVGIALTLYVEARRRWTTRIGVLAATLYFLNPVALYNSAYWGQVDSIHSACVLLAIVALNRQKPTWAGLAIGLALLQKFQSVVFLPLVLFDVYRWNRWRGLVRTLAGTVAAAVLVLAPFVRAGALGTVLDRGYVHVVGQYNMLSVNAFNLWYLTGTPSAPGDGVPSLIVEAVADGALQVPDDASWLLRLTWRRIGVALFALMVALTLAVYSRRHTASARALAAGVLGLVFFLFLTEMHERYAYPVVAVLPLWAAGGRWKERLYLLLSILLLLNLTQAQPVEEIGPDIAVLNLVLCFVFLLGLGLACIADAQGAPPDEPPAEAAQPEPDTAPPPPSAVVRGFCRLTLTGLAGAALLAGGIALARLRAPEPVDTGTRYLSDMTPRKHRQAYGQLRQDRSVEGGLIHLGTSYYLRGLGTHADSMIVYDLPDGYRRFRAVVGIDRYGHGQAGVRVYLDGKQAFDSGPLDAKRAPVEVDLPLNGAKRLRLQARRMGSKKGDHLDWALTRLEP